MIQFVLSLSANQVACLRAIRDYTDDPASHAFAGLRHFLSGTRYLLSERLVEWSPAPEGRERDPSFKNWTITRKGRLLLEVIELDIQDTALAIEAAVSKALPATQEDARDE